MTDKARILTLPTLFGERIPASGGSSLLLVVTGLSVLPFLLIQLFGASFGATDGSDFLPVGRAAWQLSLPWIVACLGLVTSLLVLTHAFGIGDSVPATIAKGLLFVVGLDIVYGIALGYYIQGSALAAGNVYGFWIVNRWGFSLSLAIAAGLASRLGRKSTPTKPAAGGVLLCLIGGLVLAVLTWRVLASQPLADQVFPGRLIQRPWELVPLVVFGLTVLLLVPSFHRLRPNRFSHALLLSLVPQSVAQAHMAFGSTVLFDVHFQVAQLLRVLAAALPLAGLILDDWEAYRERAEATNDLLRVRRRLEQKTRDLSQTHELLGQAAQKRRSVEQDLQILRKAVETTRIGVLITDPKGTVLYSNPAQAHLHGLEVEDLVGRPASLLASREAREAVTTKRLAEDLLERSRESLHLRKNGSTFPVQLTSDVVSNSQGEPLAEVTLCEDISERKMVEMDLRQSEERFRSLFESASDLIHSLSPDGTFEYTNHAWLETLGYSRAEAKELHFDKVVAPEELEAFQRQFERFLAGDSLEELETVLVSRNGERIAAHGSLNSHRREGAPRALHCIFRNITQRKKVDGLKNDFIAMVSHELRTPLTSIFASLQLLEGGAGGALPEEAQELIGIADRNSKRLAKLVEDILDVERIESGRLTFHVQPLELMPLVDHVVALSDSLARQHEVTLQVTDRVGKLKVKVDGDRLAQALTNLLSNAIKFSPRGGEVDLVVGCEDGKVSLEIRDRGPGVPEDFQEKIFQKFVQVDSPLTRSAEGTGLGLSITRTILARFGAQVCYLDREGGGSRFVVSMLEWQSEEAGDVVVRQDYGNDSGS